MSAFELPDSPSNERAGKAALWAALLLALFIGSLYFPLLFTNRVLAGGDILLYFYPYRDYAAATFRAGHIPLWNPYIFNGVPFLANPQAAVLYPLHWPLSWLSVTQQLYWSAALHSWLLGFGGYLLLRRARQVWWAALVTALVLAGSGFYGGLVGHINQMNGAAWLPWALWVLERSRGSSQRRAVASSIALFALFVTLMILAGHTQTAYINLFGLGLWLLYAALSSLTTWRVTVANLRQFLANLLPKLAIYSAGVVVAVLLAAAQLLPTLELSQLGLRSGGLTYNEVSSFSLAPWRLPWSLLPTYGLIELGPIFGAGYTEFVGYVGLAGLVLALLGAWQGRGMVRQMGLFFTGMGLFLALGRWNPFYYLLYKVVPGFDLFRVPARWLMLYTLGMALLAGLGAAQLLALMQYNTWLRAKPRLSRHVLPATCCLLVASDLLLAAQSLPHTRPTAPQAVYGVRTAPAHLLTDPIRQELAPAAMGRFLGMSTIAYDPGDMNDWRRVLLESNPPQLDPAAFADFIIDLKIQELLVPNLPLFWRIPAVDGFDGGVLPLQRYNQFMPLFVPASELVPDGRLREQIQEVPNAQLLGLLNVQYVTTDKVRDLWFEGVYYDRQIGARLDQSTPTLTIDVPITFAATHLDLIGALAAETATIDPDQPLAQVAVEDANGATLQLRFPGNQPGTAFAGPTLDSPRTDQNGAVVAYRDVEGGTQEYRARLPLPQPFTPQQITITRATDAPAFTIQAATLYDARTTMFTPLLPSDRGHFRLVHGGDVKLYENLDLRPRAYLVHKLFAAAGTEEALALIRSETLIQQGEAAVVDMDTDAPTNHTPNFALQSQSNAADKVTIVDYAAEEITLTVNNAEDAFLVLSDSYYPGWQAMIDGQATPIFPTNILFRGVEVPAGEHTVTFRYRPQSWRLGLWLSGSGFVLWLVLLALGTTTLLVRRQPIRNHRPV